MGEMNITPSPTTHLTLTGRDSAWRGLVAGLGFGLAVGIFAFAAYLLATGTSWEIAGKVASGAAPLGLYGAWALFDWKPIGLVTGLLAGIASAWTLIATDWIGLIVAAASLLLGIITYFVGHKGSIFRP